VRETKEGQTLGALKPLELAEARAARNVANVRANARAELVAQWQKRYAEAKTPTAKRMAITLARQVGVSEEELKGK